MKKASFKIRRKIILAFLFCFLSVLLFAIFSFQSQTEIGRRLRLVEVADDLVNNLLEVRRFEKNFFLYKHPASLHEALIHVDRVEALYLKHERAILHLNKNKKEPVFYQTLLCYKETLTELQAAISKEDRPIEQIDFSALEESLRIIAHTLLDIAGTWAKEERDRIDHLFHRALYLFIAALVFFVIIGIGVAFYISRLLTSPLVRMQQAMGKIAHGDFTPIPEDQNHAEEFAPLFKAFNRMINELEERQEQLVQARKISAIGTFTSGIAHELNNPVNNIVLTAEALKEDFGTIDEQEALGMIQDIIAQSERASEIIKNLLDFSRSEKPEMVSTSIYSVIYDTLKLVKNQLLLSGVEETMEVPTDLPNVRGDYKTLQQVFLNLFINAIQAMRNGGKLIVKSDVVEDGASVRISVSDTGEGIDPKDIHHIFDPFFTTKEVGKGTGLGLSVTYGILQKHGGTIEAHSQKGHGATFIVTLPAEREKN
ncbi:MAG: HAMP domain-containing histidine kinase [Deltaproteobacteria bacterium]|nr:HAMP domain-containing histidine kinase [Deltaproteobacteria bacterium]